MVCFLICVCQLYAVVCTGLYVSKSYYHLHVYVIVKYCVRPKYCQSAGTDYDFSRRNQQLLPDNLFASVSGEFKQHGSSFILLFEKYIGGAKLSFSVEGGDNSTTP